MARERNAYMGPRLRRLRRDLGITQAVMAHELGISPSYVALIERNQRPMTADMLLRLAQTYKLDIASLAGERGEDFAARLAAALRDPMFSDLDLAATEIEDFGNSFPGTAEALVRLYTAYQESQLALADRGAVDASGLENDPVAEARRFLEARNNCFPGIDDVSEALAGQIGDAGGFSAYLTERSIRVRRLPADVMVGAVRRFDHHRGELVLDERLDRASATFQMALQIAYLHLDKTIDEPLSETQFRTPNGERLTRRALANYAAAALMMPYRAFARAAESRRYDIEALSRQFGASFEQVAHRLTTLQKPGQEGVPFFFIRVDAAGNVSKRLDGAGFPFARHGGSCPLWSLHRAFQRPRQILTELVELPDGERFFSVVRSVTAGGGSFSAPRIERAIALGCQAKHARRLVYADGRDLDTEKATPIGVSCRLCHRADCMARAEPPIGRQLQTDDIRRTEVPFGLADR